ncbi:DUF1491 family protein [Blastochloris viridis]|uniref:DUF1491 family protein n=1 Tax=Blastochloris viridis TaxID=1079 RepID=A0A0H5BHR8_BLAVI|nr:DUF1491 family protein [Blastochloris viridis]ALK10144.1 hypothetical protein BVIR_2377 [Blastochloris viridis]BAR99926.1 hypothetical protein BV133_2333 [Blastochloris viridis]CUU42808.1 hypothetical protein BVIRIDIS_18230 [Blastochloris viridis]
MSRLKSAIWVSAYVRRCQVEGAYALVRRRGSEEAGAIVIELDRLDGRVALFGPAPQSAFDDAAPERAFCPLHANDTVTPAEAEAILARELEFDSDLWIVVVEDRAGRHFLDAVVPR